jgi:hypothetical protein
MSSEGVDERAPTAWAQAQPLDASDDTHGESRPGSLAVRAGEYDAGESLSMLADEVLRHKRAHGMADEHDWQARMVGGDALVQPPEIVDAFAPAVPLGKEAEILRRRGRPAMAAMIAGIDHIASASQRLGKPGVSAGMLDQAVGNLHHRLRRRFGQPAIYEEREAIRRGEGKGRAYASFPPSNR